MADVVPTTRKQSLQIAGLIVGTLVTFNTGFYFLSAVYFADSSDVAINAIRGAFFVMTGLVALASFIAALAPRVLGHGLACLLGLASILGGAEAWAHDMAPVMSATLLIVGILLPALAWRSWLHSRAAWAFLIALVAVFGGVDFFGAPKVRALLGIGLWTALILPGLQIVTVVALAMLKDEYRDRA